MTDTKLDTGIPVLTEIIVAPRENEVADHPVAAPWPAAPATQQEPAAVSASSMEHMTDEQLRQMENELAERLLRQMLQQIDLVLEQRVRDSLADVLQTAVEGLATEIRQGLQQALKDVVARAVAQEMARLKETKT